jgi:hypothetical protein
MVIDQLTPYLMHDVIVCKRNKVCHGHTTCASVLGVRGGESIRP